MWSHRNCYLFTETTPQSLLRKTVSAANAAESCKQYSAYSSTVMQSGVRPRDVVWVLWRDWCLHGKKDRRALYFLHYVRLPKANKKLPPTPTYPGGVALYYVFLSCHSKLDYCHCHIPTNPETEVPVHRVSEVCRLHSNKRTKGAIWLYPTYLIHQPGAGLVMCLETYKKRDGERADSYKCLQPECDINVCVQCVHIRYLCTTLINTMFDSSFTKPLSDVEELAMKQTL